jgi:hypothetical protein
MTAVTGDLAHKKTAYNVNLEFLQLKLLILVDISLSVSCTIGLSCLGTR